MNQLTDAGYTAYVGIDWAAAKHDICVQAAAGGAREFACISSQPEGIEAWAQDLYQRFGGPIAVALELSKGPIVSALQKYDFMVASRPGRRIFISASVVRLPWPLS